MMVLDFLNGVLSVLWLLVKIRGAAAAVMFILAVIAELRKRLKGEERNGHD